MLPEFYLLYLRSTVYYIQDHTSFFYKSNCYIQGSSKILPSLNREITGHMETHICTYTASIICSPFPGSLLQVLKGFTVNFQAIRTTSEDCWLISPQNLLGHGTCYTGHICIYSERSVLPGKSTSAPQNYQHMLY